MSNQREVRREIAELLYARAETFINNPHCLGKFMGIAKHFRWSFQSGADLSACLLAYELIFTYLLKNDLILIKGVSRLLSNKEDHGYKYRLGKYYPSCFKNITRCLKKDSFEVQIQSLSTAMAILMYEGRFPLRDRFTKRVPVDRLHQVLWFLVRTNHNNNQLINKYTTEYLVYDDILFFTWQTLPNIIKQFTSDQTYIYSYLLLLEKALLQQNADINFLCSDEENFTYDEFIIPNALTKILPIVVKWKFANETRKQFLMLLLELLLPHIDEPQWLTDFLVESLDIGGAVSMMALYGIFHLIEKYNANYLNIFTKLYSMFEQEIFHSKNMKRLLFLTDILLTSTHLSDIAAAAFAKRLARLALFGPSEDTSIIGQLIANLILRHPTLQKLLDPPFCSPYTDPYIVEERDPLECNALASSLWEIESVRHRVSPNVAINFYFVTPLPTVQWVLDNTSEDVFDREITTYRRVIASAFDQPNCATLIRQHKILQYQNLSTLQSF